MKIILNQLSSVARRKIRKKLVERDGMYCWICCRYMKPHDRTIDHVIPRSEGGTNVLENLKLAHRFCNESRTWPPITALKMASLTPKQRRKIYG